MTECNKLRLVTFKDLLDSQELVNITLETEDGGQQKAHLEILAAISPYFRRLIGTFKNNAWETISVPGTSKDTLAEIVNYIYTGQVSLREERVKPLIDAAELLVVPGVVKLCKQFLASNISVSNCIGRFNFATSYQYADLKEKALTFILANFEDVYKSNESFIELQIDDLVSILSSDLLNVNDEGDRVLAMLKWVEADPNTRVYHLSQRPALRQVGLCSFKFFEDHIWTNELISRNEDCHGVLYQASQLFADLQNGDSPQIVFDLHHPFPATSRAQRDHLRDGRMERRVCHQPHGDLRLQDATMVPLAQFRLRAQVSLPENSAHIHPPLPVCLPNLAANTKSLNLGVENLSCSKFSSLESNEGTIKFGDLFSRKVGT
ncbi:kelch-like protein 2 [Caerostris extrusa]|uniref:Kelch-like protein 2 n=1 Tax=Caerostris extrusa TaxID=172846 RepID=A0AAV4NQZ5_CAEEX|nr:kelch-like protein 2 [Caerostris extrusa]